jgi:uncharacterized glyoxalase superfamily protein PhnB
MADSSPPVLFQLNLLVKDVPTSVAFYRRLGLTVEEASRPEWARHHATALMPGGVRLELDSLTFAKEWNEGWQGHAGNSAGVIFFSVALREDVDRVHDDLVASGAPSQHPPTDAFWGARYAIVLDPDENPVGVMSPIDPARRRAPPFAPSAPRAGALTRR